MNPAPDSPEAQAALVHIDAAKMRGSAVALLDAIGLDKTLGEIEMLKGHVIEQARRRGMAQGWSR